MTDSLFSTNYFFGLHGVTRWVAISLLMALLLFVSWQFVRARNPSGAFAWRRSGSLRTAVGTGVVLLGVVPIVALSLLLSEHSAHSRHERMKARIEEMALSVAYAVERTIDKHKTGITAAASSVNASADFSGPSVERALLRYHEIYGDFLTMLGTDQTGNIVASSSVLQGKLQAVEGLAGLSVADREYFQAPMENGFPFVSQVFRGRGLGVDPIVAISASLRDAAGSRVGIIEGSLDLGIFETIDREHGDLDGASMILVDNRDRVIYSSSGTNFAALEELGNDALMVAARDYRQHNSFDYTTSSPGEPGHFVAAYATTSMGWRVFIRVSTNPIAQQMIGDYMVGLALLVLTLFISLLMASAIIRRVRFALRALNRMVEGFSLDATTESIQIPEFAPTEFKPIFQLMQARSRQLRQTYKRLSNSIDAGENLRRELTQAIANKDVEIAERTEELERANALLSTQSRRDPLTKIANRREFERFEARIWNLGVREEIPVAVILVDIDHFKAFNDTLGHQAGDECLKRVAVALSESATRPLDLVARFGGEEFVAVLGGAAVADALVVAEAMRNAVLDLDIDHPTSPNGVVSVSVGAASVLPDADRDAASLVRAADQALYRAKESGRNCVVYWRDDELQVYDPSQHSLDSSNIIRMLAGDRHRGAKSG